MKNKIAVKLTLVLAAVLLLFSLLIGGVYLRFLDEIAMTDVWLVDEDLSLITVGPMSYPPYSYADLPANAEAVVKAAFQGNTTFGTGFSELLQTPTLTVGAPIRAGEAVLGVLLLHSPVEGMNAAIDQGLGLLFGSLGAALALSIPLSLALALAITRPLQRMRATAGRLTQGDYTAKTGVEQKDEIGELATAIDELSEQLERASQESAQLDQLRRDFVTNISHELRTPVTVIRGSLEALCDEVVTAPEQVKAYHEQMRQEVLFLQRLVSDLLDLSRLQNTDFPIEQQEINLGELLSDAVRSANRLAQAKKISVRSPSDPSSVTVTGDYGRLRQMLLVILDNAIKFSPPESEVDVTLADRLVTIRDRGAGIAPADLPHIFDRFYRARTAENREGTGLGLAIAKQIADRHQLNIAVSSVLGEGTEFRLQF